MATITVYYFLLRQNLIIVVMRGTDSDLLNKFGPVRGKTNNLGFDQV